ncbi:MAG: TRAP transporter permease [Hyphomicrobiaceae bacterium]
MAKLNPLSLDFWFSVGARREPTGWLAWLLTPLAVALGVFVIVSATVVIIQPWTLTAVFLCGVMTLAFLAVGASPHSDPKSPSITDWVLSIASFASGVFFIIQSEQLDERISLLTELTTLQIVFGLIMVVLSVEITRRSTGLGLTIIVVCFIAYNLLGHGFTGVLGHAYIDIRHFLDIMVYTTDGVMGLPARVTASYAYLFVLFGTLLLYSKGGDFYNDVAAALTGRYHGGPAKVAVVSSGLYGMISGSPTADVVTTGSVTIPMMKKAGFRSEVAAGIEVAASTGGSIMPPVMGSAAFLMAEYTGIDYKDIAIAALLPALLYYTCVFSQVHFRSMRHGIGGMDPSLLPKLSTTFRRHGMFLLPLVVLTWALLEGYTPTMVAIFGSISVIAVSWLRADTRLSPVSIWKSISETTFRIVPVAGATAAAGLVIGGITMTGLAAKFSHVVYGMANADVFMTLVVAAALTLVLGCGMPTPSAYILAAVLMGPLMNKLGVNILAGQLFILYFAVLSAITPPVAVAAFAASSISGDNPITIAGHAVKLALAAFLVPFVFVYAPELLWQGPLWKTAVTFLTAGLGLILLAMAIEGHKRLAAQWWNRLPLAAGGIFLVTPSLWGIAAGLALATAGIGSSWLATSKPQVERA